MHDWPDKVTENECGGDEKWKPNPERITEIEQSDDFGSKHLKEMNETRSRFNFGKDSNGTKITIFLTAKTDP